MDHLRKKITTSMSSDDPLLTDGLTYRNGKTASKTAAAVAEIAFPALSVAVAQLVPSFDP